MGKKRRRDDEEENPGEAPHGAGAPRESVSKKSKKGRELHVSELNSEDLEDRERAAAEDLRKARANQAAMRSDPPQKSSNRINWQREVTRANNTVHRAEQSYNEVKREIERRRRQQ
eukprot:gb/GFBE01071449.1/.p1 GENE.gb/GFBE01071449.1/~~gb/GFBE01071449.1/.p1  ORF type:complete len:116 (+),score=24.38 gb/GFBE01071449.1/:1-348(+)